MMLFQRVAFIEISQNCERLTSYVTSYNVSQEESRKICSLLTAVRTIQTHSHELWSKIVNLNFDLNSVGGSTDTVRVQVYQEEL